MLPVNPSPLANVTYDCAILDGTTRTSTPEALFYLEPFDDGGSNQSRMCSLDWDGKLRRQLDRGLAVQQSPDGSRLLAVDYPIVNSAPAVYLAIDERNQVFDRLTTIWKSEAVWADDSRHLCYIADSNPTGQGGVAFLNEQLPGSPPRRVAIVGGVAYFPAAPSSGGGAPAPFIAGPHLLACSVSADRAVVLNPASGIVSLWRLSDGVELRTHDFGPLFDPYVNRVGFDRLVASRDGRYLAENIEGAHEVPVIDLISDTVAARLPVRVLGGFSSDSTRAVVQLNGQTVGVIDWQSQRVIRRLAGSYPYAWARPDSADLLVGMPSTRHQFGFDLYIVRGDGTAFEVARSVEVIGE